MFTKHVGLFVREQPEVINKSCKTMINGTHPYSCTIQAYKLMCSDVTDVIFLGSTACSELDAASDQASRRTFIAATAAAPFVLGSSPCACGVIGIKAALLQRCQCSVFLCYFN